MSEPAVLVEGLSFAYPGGSNVLERVSLRVEAGEVLAVIGPNGGGKSTLLKLIMGLLEGDAGEVRVCGVPPREARRRGLVGYVPQRASAELSFPLSARQAAEMGALRGVSPLGPPPRAVRERVERCLELVGAAEYADRPVGHLSGGQLQRVLIARALAPEPRVLALDEPLVGVDAGGQRRFSALIDRLHGELGLAILLVSHDLRAVVSGGAHCDRVACLRKTLHFHAAPGGITPQVLAEVFQHDLADVFGAPDVHVHVDAHRAEECADPAHAHGPAPTVPLRVEPREDRPG